MPMTESERDNIRERVKESQARKAQREAEQAAADQDDIVNLKTEQRGTPEPDQPPAPQPAQHLDFDTQSPTPEASVGDIDDTTSDTDANQKPPLIVTPLMRRKFKELVRKTLKHTAQAMGIRIAEFERACYFNLEQWAEQLGVTTRMVTKAGAVLRESKLFMLSPGGGAGWANYWQPRYELV